MNAHKKLLVLIPEIYNNEKQIDLIFNHIMVNNPSAIIKAYEEINNVGVGESPNSIKYQKVNEMLNDIDVDNISVNVFNSIAENIHNRIMAIKYLRGITKIGLSQAKNIFDEVWPKN